MKSASAREVPRNTRRRPFVDGRSTRRGWSGEAPDDRVGGDAIEEDEDEEADEQYDQEQLGELMTRMRGFRAESTYRANLERSSRVMMLPGDFQWDDVGTWAALGRVRTPDAASAGISSASDGRAGRTRSGSCTGW